MGDVLSGLIGRLRTLRGMFWVAWVGRFEERLRTMRGRFEDIRGTPTDDERAFRGYLRNAYGRENHVKSFTYAIFSAHFCFLKISLMKVCDFLVAKKCVLPTFFGLLPTFVYETGHGKPQ